MSHGYCGVHINMSYIRRVGRYYPFVSNRIFIRDYIVVFDFTISTTLSPLSSVLNIDNMYVNTGNTIMADCDAPTIHKLPIGSLFTINQVILVGDNIHALCTSDLISINPMITNTCYSTGYYLNSATETIDQLNIQTRIVFTQ